MTQSDPPHRALCAAFIEHRSNFHAIAYKIVGGRDFVEDVLQDAYLKLVEGVCAREIINPLGYCCQVVRNTALDYLRRRAVEARYIEQTKDGELPDVPSDARTEAGIDERRILERVEKVLATLPERTRLVFELYRLKGLTQREIAAGLDVSATLVNFMIRDVMLALASCRDLLTD